MIRYAEELEVARQAARVAADIILRHYAAGGIAVDTKDDQSPVTQADRDASTAIVDLLRAAFPDDGVLSEELPDDLIRLTKKRVWIVDPLDGTRDFVARTGDFCVHVGLAEGGEAVLGVVAQPVTGALYFATAGSGAFVEDEIGRRRLSVSTVQDLADVRMGVSRLNASNRLGQCLRAANLEARAAVMGASVKHMALARGVLDGVINLSPGEQEWDTCAPEVIVREAGGAFTDGSGRPFRYNQNDLIHDGGSIASNGACHDALVALIAPALAPIRSGG
ncbi:MAG TPA: 3'(2'),5'-bisphosphate nucleotidase CysQ [Polyangia bacterium]|nr:3'(2'),5'-bisphosphate nucleotidase CysQ [Polyangia bacterium]